MERRQPWPPRRGRRLGVVVLAFGGVLLAGCSGRPRPPAVVQGEAVYHNRREGFQLKPPPGWSQHSRAEYPPGRYDREQPLVKYKRLDEPGPAFFGASMRDLPESTAPEAYLRERPPGPEGWQPQGSAEPLQVGGLPATRVTFAGTWEEGEKARVVKEVVAVRRGERVYFFTGVFPATNTEVRTAIRAAVDSIVWDPARNRGNVP